MSLRFVLLSVGLAALHLDAVAVEVPRATIERSIDACQKYKRAADPTAPRDPALLQSLCTCSTEAYFAGFTDVEWRALKKQAAGKDKERAALQMKDRSDAAEISCRASLKIDTPKE